MATSPSRSVAQGMHQPIPSVEAPLLKVLIGGQVVDYKEAGAAAASGKQVRMVTLGRGNKQSGRSGHES